MSSCVYNNNPSSALVVNVSNGLRPSDPTSSKGGNPLESSVRVKGRQLAEIHVSQIALLSSRHLRLESVLSIDSDQPVVNRHESANFCLNTAQTPGEKDTITVSDVRWKGGGSGNTGTTDDLYMDFLKAGFVFEGKARKPGLLQDLVVVSWLGKLAGGGAGDSVQGQSFIRLNSSATAIEVETADVVDSAHTRVSEVTSNREPPFSKFSSLKVTADYESKFCHDFESRPLATVPFHVVVENPCPTPTSFVYKVMAGEEGAACAFVGCTQAKLTVAGCQTKKLKFQIQVSSPGIYSFQRAFKFQAVNHGDISSTQPDQDELIPLHISILVEDVRSQK